MICPECKGKKKIAVIPKVVKGRVIMAIDCYRCKNTGEVPDIQAEWITKGKVLREDRIKRGNSIKKESLLTHIDVFDLHQAEYGLIDPDTLPIPFDEQCNDDGENCSGR